MNQNGRSSVLRESRWWDSVSGPFRYRVFASLWLTSFISNVGSMTQVVGVSWLMISLAPTSATLVALVQVSAALPTVLLAVPAGALADAWDRRATMLVGQYVMLLLSVILALLAHFSAVTPSVLLILTFLTSCGAALTYPATYSCLAEQVPKSEISAAVSLNAFGLNLARVVGPLFGGAVVVVAGITATFCVNAISFVGLIAVLTLWRRQQAAQVRSAEALIAGMKAGFRYAQQSRDMHAVLVRGLLFGCFGSTVWALAPVIAKNDTTGGGVTVYSYLLGALGTGAVLGALGSASARRKLGQERLVRASTLAYGVGAIVVGLSSSLAISMAALFVAGIGWVGAISTFNVVVQLSSPQKILSRAVAFLQTFILGGFALGSWLSGLASDVYGVSAAVMGGGALMALSAALGWFLPVSEAAWSRGPMPATYREVSSAREGKS